MAQRRQDPITKAHKNVERVTKKYNELNDKFRKEAGKALEDEDQEKYDKLADDYMDEESKLRREVEQAHADLRLARQGQPLDSEQDEEPEQVEEPTNPARDNPDEE